MDKFHEEVQWEKVFPNQGPFDYDATLLAVRKAVAEHTWTDTVDFVLDSILWKRENSQGLANRAEVDAKTAHEWRSVHGYGVLKMMADKGWLKPVLNE